MYRIFIVEDDPIIAKALKEYLERWNFQVALTEDFSQVLAEFGQFDPHLVLLDISLPFFNGYYWCGEIRKISKVPILFLSSALTWKCCWQKFRHCCGAAMTFPAKPDG